MKSNIKRKLGQNIKIERIRKELTQEELAEKIDMSLSYISKLEQGITSPTAFALFKISKTLEIPMEQFFDGIY